VEDERRDLGAVTSSPSTPVTPPTPSKLRWQWLDPVTRKEYSGTKTSSNHADIIQHRMKLPIYEFRPHFLHAVENNQAIMMNPMR
jgi:HrpA-like RNA helicase